MDARLKVFPKEFLDRLPSIFPQGILKDIHKAYCEEKPTTGRINTLKGNPTDLLNRLKRHIKNIQMHDQVPWAVDLSDLSTKKLTGLDLYENGEIYLQNLSSQIPPLLLNPQAHERVLDLCASPGSKTSQMAALMGNQGSIVALEPDPIRFQRLVHNLQHLGVTNTEALHRRGESYCRDAAAENQTFDAILADVPCSGDGTFYIHRKTSFGHWNLKFVQQTSELQKKLLKRAFSLLKPGGRLVYSTCSISPEENEMVVQSLLEDEPSAGFFKPQKNLSIYKRALERFGDQIFNPKIPNHCFRIHPSGIHEGFFMAPLTKALTT